MTVTTELLEAWMDDEEKEQLEFKEAKKQYDFGKLVNYCVALANEGSGKFVLGVSNERPRRVVGSQAFRDTADVKRKLLDKLRLRIDVDVVDHPDGRVVVFHVPSRPPGRPMQNKGAYWMRSGESLVPMTPEQLKRIFDESGPDYSSEICAPANTADLDPVAIARFREMWARKSGNSSLQGISVEQLLADAELTIEGGVTYAALILLGTHRALGKYLAQAEVVFEYRATEASGPAQQRRESRRGFFLFMDDLWNVIDLRNDVQHFQHGLFVLDIPTFNETVIRECILNAVSHRDYRLGGSIFVRQLPRRLEVVSPGGFPPGITEENILWQQIPRNRRIAEVFAKCGLVERAGQGMNRMFEECIKETKPLPDFSGTDSYQVSVTLEGNIQDVRFLRFLEQVGSERLASFGTEDFLVLDLIRREQPVPDNLVGRLPVLRENGIIERVGHGRGTRYILSHRFYRFLGEPGVYTRTRGLDREARKSLLLQHIEKNRDEGSSLSELMQIFPDFNRRQVQNLLHDLKAENCIHVMGRTKAARWYPGQGPEYVAPKPPGN